MLARNFTGSILHDFRRRPLERIGSIAELRQAILEGAIHRLRPKLLTEGAAIVSIAPMLWASGVGAEVIRPMAAPVLGGLLIADEVIDVFPPVLYFAVKKRQWARAHHLSFGSRLAPNVRRDQPIPIGSGLPSPGPGDGPGLE